MSSPFRQEISESLRPFYDEICDLSKGMFAELERHGFLKKGLAELPRRNREILASIWNLSSRFGDSLNHLYPLFSPQNPCRQMQTEVVSAIGIKEEHLTSLWIQSMISHFLANVESVFRFTLIFFLSDRFFKHAKCMPKHMTLNSLLIELGKIYEPAKRFDTVFDKDIRNSLAHGSFWFEKREICLASDPHLKEIRRMHLEEFMKVVIRANVAAIAFIHVLHMEINKGTFRR